jgi:hypothetical protein
MREENEDRAENVDESVENVYKRRQANVNNTIPTNWHEIKREKACK